MKKWKNPELAKLAMNATQTPTTLEAFGEGRVICYLCGVTFANADAYNKHLIDIPGNNGGKTCGTNPGNAESFGYTS